MSLRVLGTGAADGWPNPFCRCASCAAERAAGRTRAQTAALVDDVLLLDCGPETPQAAARAGLSLDRVHTVLLTHAHSDHTGPSFLLHRSWVRTEPLVVVGPPDVVAGCRPWVASGAPVELRAVAPGEVLELRGYSVGVLAATHTTGLGAPGEADSVLYDVTSPAGSRLLYATDTGPLVPETLSAVTGARYDAVLLEETFGDRAEPAPGHLNLAGFAETLRLLRAAGAVVATTDVVAVHLSHHNPPTTELARRLADWGARVVEDGALLGAPPGSPPAARRTLVLGGARSGKSHEAERLLASEAEVTYLATAYPPGDDDPDWAARVAAHRARRPAHWRTVETLDLAGMLAAAGPPVLVDCLTLWLTRVMDAHGAWPDDDQTPARARQAERAVLDEVEGLVSAWRATGRRVVAVSNEVGQGVVPATAAGRRFRDLMGLLNARLAAETEDVRWCVAGRVSEL